MQTRPTPVHELFSKTHSACLQTSSHFCPASNTNGLPCMPSTLDSSQNPNNSVRLTTMATHPEAEHMLLMPLPIMMSVLATYCRTRTCHSSATTHSFAHTRRPVSKPSPDGMRGSIPLYTIPQCQQAGIPLSEWSASNTHNSHGCDTCASSDSKQ